MDVVEVVARFGGTILDVTHVAPTQTYRIGTSPRTNLAVPGLVSFPLVEHGKIRVPVGVRVVERDGWTELRFGDLRISIARTRMSRTPLSRPRVDRRPHAFVLASLIAHVALWLVAVVTAPFEKLAIPQARRAKVVSRLHEPPPEPAPKPKPKSEPVPKRQKPAVADVQPSRPARVPREKWSPAVAAAVATGSHAEEMHGDAAYWANRVGKSFDDAHLAEALADLRPEDTYFEDQMYAKGFGGGRGHFDPGDPVSIESGAYSTQIFDVKQCANKAACSVTGPIPPLFVRMQVLEHMGEIHACWERHASEPGTIALAFTIMPDGSVHEMTGSGLGETGACAARIIGEVGFKALGNDYHPPKKTRVKWTIKING